MYRKLYKVCLVALLCLVALPKICRAEAAADSLPICSDDNLDGEALRSRAGEWFSKGTRLVEKSQFGAAAEAFRCSNRLVPHPATLLNIAKAVLLTDDLDEAVRLYKSFVSKYPEHEKRSAVIKEIERLEQKRETSQNPVEAPREAPSTQKSRDDSSAASPLLVPPVPALPPAAPPVASFEFKGEARRRDGMKKWGWALAGIGGTGMIVGVTFQILASYNYLRLQDDLWWSEFAHRRENYERYQRTATIALSISGVVLGSGMTLFLFRRGESKGQTEKTVAFAVAPWKLSMDIFF